MSDASKRQEGGNHYAQLPEHAQPWNVLKHWLTPEEYRGWQKGNAIVYLARERQKGGDTDISKARHHLERLIEEFSQEFPDLPGDHPQPDYEDVKKEYQRSTARYFAEHIKKTIDGWIPWEGGECPVTVMTLVDVKYRDGVEALGIPAMMYHQIPDTRNATDWGAGRAWITTRDIVAWRLHAKAGIGECESQDAAKVAEPDADGWIEHNGGQRPVDLDAVVEVKFHNPGSLSDLGIAKKAKTWNWGRGPGGMLTDLCIVAYRLVKEEPQWPMVSEPGDHNKIKAAYKPGMEWMPSIHIEEVLKGECEEYWMREGEPAWTPGLGYAIRPAQGEQA